MVVDTYNEKLKFNFLNVLPRCVLFAIPLQQMSTVSAWNFFFVHHVSTVITELKFSIDVWSWKWFCFIENSGRCCSRVACPVRGYFTKLSVHRVQHLVDDLWKVFRVVTVRLPGWLDSCCSCCSTVVVVVVAKAATVLLLVKVVLVLMVHRARLVVRRFEIISETGVERRIVIRLVSRELIRIGQDALVRVVAHKPGIRRLLTGRRLDHSRTRIDVVGSRLALLQIPFHHEWEIFVHDWVGRLDVIIPLFRRSCFRRGKTRVTMRGRNHLRTDWFGFCFLVLIKIMERLAALNFVAIVR